ncbi:Rnh203p [Saccharomyces eubayanus]|uniref:Rnh203p n=1 Tax=Saccharomyces eubayanus TaxID=1080349 RepID=UPI0006C22289|nr:RNH203-like protein [Saccharomyces eubayanus]KOG97862.1 RNH203-like protein [Saccharomyces eubayanus]
MTKDTGSLDAYTVNFMPCYTEYQGPTTEFKDYKFDDTIYFRGKELQKEKPASTATHDTSSAALSNGAILSGNTVTGKIVTVNNYEREGTDRNELGRLQELIYITNVINQ